MRFSFQLVIICFFIIIVLFGNNVYASEWIDVSPINVKENLYSSRFLTTETGYVAGWGSSGGIFLTTTNGGDNWDIQKLTGTYPFSCNIFQADGNNTIMLAGFATDCNCGVFMVRKPGEQIFTEFRFDGLSANFPLCFSFYNITILDQFTYLLSGNNSTILKTTDGGIKWYKTNSIPSSDQFNSMIFYNDSLGLAWSGISTYKSDHLFKTIDGGNNWASLIDFRNDNITIGNVVFIDSETILIFGSKNNCELIMKSSNSGLTWDTVFKSDRIETLLAGYIYKNNGYAIGENSRVLKTSDNGDSWFLLKEESGKKQLTSFLSLGIDNSVLGYATGLNGLVLKYVEPVNVESPATNNDIKIIYDSFSGTLKSYFAPEFYGRNYEIIICNLLGEKIYQGSGIIDEVINSSSLKLYSGIYIYKLNIEKSVFSGKFMANNSQ